MSATAPWEQEEYVNAVALVGMAGRFRGANAVEALWDVVRDGRETVHRMTQAELIAMECPSQIKEHPCHVPVTAQLERAEEFDADFFGFTPAEALALDPQLRLMLETSWHAFEDAGHVPGEERAGITGVFAGAAQSFYWLFHTRPSVRDHLGAAFGQNLVLSGQGFNSTWISHKLNLTGPSVNINTACSTGLVAAATGCQNLLDYSCDVALVVTASVFSPRHWGYWAEPGGILSPDGYCRPFDATASGTIMGEGVCALLLRRLDDAINDGDHIHAVIRGYGVNNDGARKAGYTAPSVKGQESVIRMAHRSASVSSADISYIEAHGTGTKLGDPVEFAGLCAAFDEPRAHPCRIGSVKGNIGHLNIAAGTASLMKAVLMLEHDYMPPLAYYSKCNPEMSIDGSPFQLCVEGMDWPRDMPRLVGVSSFGFGGTNCHMVVERTPDWARRDSALGRCAHSCEADASMTGVPREHPLMFSAPDEAGLQRQLQVFETWFSDNANADIAAVSAVLRGQRKHFSHRAMLMAASAGEAALALREGRVRTAQPPQAVRLVVLLSDYSQLSPSRLVALAMKLIREYPELHGVFTFFLQEYEIAVEDVVSSLPVLEKDALCLERLALALGHALTELVRAMELPVGGVAECCMGEVAGTCQAKILSREKSLRELSLSPTEPYRPPFGEKSDSTVVPYFAKAEDINIADGLPVVFLKYRLTAKAAGEEKSPSSEHAVVVDFSDLDASFVQSWDIALGELFLSGVSPFSVSEKPQYASLPGYAFAPERYWLPLEFDEPTPAPQASASDAADDGAPIEQLMLTIWRDALGLETLGTNDDFFHVGGTSMTALRILADIELQLGVELTMSAFMEARTVEGLIQTIAEQLEAAPELSI